LINPLDSLKSYIDYLFRVTLFREPTDEEFELFKAHMYDSDNEVLIGNFNIIHQNREF